MEPTPEEKEQFRKLCLDENGKITPVGVLALVLTINKALQIWTKMLKDDPKA